MRRAASWALAGMCLSPIAGIVVWRLLGGDVPRLFPLFTAVVGAAAGLVALVRSPPWLRAHAGSTFAIAYLAMFGWAIAWAGDATGAWILAVALVAFATTTLIRRRCSDSVRWELAKLSAAVVWVGVFLLMPLFLLGIVLIPPAVSLTSASRARRWNTAGS